MVTGTRIISFCSKTKDYCFLAIRKVYHQVFFKSGLPAVIIKRYCFKLFFEKHFCLVYDQNVFWGEGVVDGKRGSSEICLKWGGGGGGY